MTAEAFDMNKMFKLLWINTTSNPEQKSKSTNKKKSLW